MVDAVGAWTSATQSIHFQGLLHVIQLLNGTNTRYLKVGGANTLSLVLLENMRALDIAYWVFQMMKLKRLQNVNKDAFILRNNIMKNEL